MRARLYRPRTTDAVQLDRLLEDNRHGDVRLDADRIIVVDRLGMGITGVLAWRPAGFIHELVVAPRKTRILDAAALGNFALGEAQARQYDIRQAVFLVDSANSAMLRFVRDMGAVEQTGKVFTLNF